jgi:undecaprenyl-diphosphatase
MRKKKVASYIVINTGLCVLLNQLVKRIFRRTRPIGIALIEQGGFSFPSGHSMMALAFYGYFIYLIQKSKLSKNKKMIYSIILGTIIILVGISRIYLGVHFASDVLAAYCLSSAFLVIVIYIERKKKSL